MKTNQTKKRVAMKNHLALSDSMMNQYSLEGTEPHSVIHTKFQNKRSLIEQNRLRCFMKKVPELKKELGID